MTAIHERYVREMHRRFGQFACWPPNTPLRLGDVGLLRRDRFDKVTTLAEVGINSLPDEVGVPVLLEYCSAGQVQLSVDGDAEVIPVVSPAACKVSISFEKEGATFFQAAQAVRESIKDLPKLERALQPLLARKIWRPEWVVVTSVQRTGPAVILVSNQRNAKVEFSVSADAFAPAVPLAEAAARITFSSMNGVAVQVIAPDGTTPVFGAAQFRKRLTGKAVLSFRGEKLRLTELGWDDVDAGE